MLPVLFVDNKVSNKSSPTISWYWKVMLQKFQQSSNHLTRKRKRWEKEGCLLLAGRAEERKSVGCRELGPMVESWSCAVLRGYAHMGPCNDASLCSFSCHSHCSSLLFREAVGGAITSRADTTAILSTLCPLHVRFVILQQGQGISSDRCLRLLKSIDQVKLINGFLFHRVGHKVFIAQGHLDSWNILDWKELLEVIYFNLPTQIYVRFLEAC